MEKQDKDNNFLECYHATLNEMANTFFIKNERYGDSFTQTMDDYGMVTSMIRVTDKFNRLKTLYQNKNLDEDDESIVDTMLDMANYLVMTIAYIKSREESKNIYEALGVAPKEKTPYTIPPEYADASIGNILWNK